MLLVVQVRVDPLKLIVIGRIIDSIYIWRFAKSRVPLIRRYAYSGVPLINTNSYVSSKATIVYCNIPSRPTTAIYCIVQSHYCNLCLVQLLQSTVSSNTTTAIYCLVQIHYCNLCLVQLLQSTLSSNYMYYNLLSRSKTLLSSTSLVKATEAFMFSVYGAWQCPRPSVSELRQ